MNGCCCRQRKNRHRKSDKVNKEPRKQEAVKSSSKQSKRKISFTTTTASSDCDDGGDAVYDADMEIRDYDQRQIRMSSHDHKEDIAKSHQHLAEQVYYPPLARGHSRLPLQEQRGEAVRLKQLAKMEPPATDPRQRKSLLDRSHDVGEVFTRESIQKQQLYSFLVATEPRES